MIKVAVGSQNPAKVQAVQAAFERVWPAEKILLVSIDVPSGVSDQPMSDIETVCGAKNRAQAAIVAKDCDFGVGIEGGLQELDGQWLTGNIAAVVDKAGNVGIGLSTRIAVPHKVYERVAQGGELSHAVDAIFGTKHIGKNEGVLGLLSNNLITRTSASQEAVIAALSSLPPLPKG